MNETTDNRLTNREKDVLALLAEGKSYKEIAGKWGCTRARIQQVEQNANQKIEREGKSGLAFQLMLDTLRQIAESDGPFGLFSQYTTSELQSPAMSFARVIARSALAKAEKQD